MKKPLLLITAISLSAVLSACSQNNSSWSNKDQNRQMCESHMRDMHDKITEYYFNKIDTNHDGVITWKENEAFSRKMFKEADVAHDGKLTLEEVIAHNEKMREQMKRDMANSWHSKSMTNGDMSDSNESDKDK